MLRQTLTRSLARPLRPQPPSLCPQCTRRTLFGRPPSRSQALDTLNISRLQKESVAYWTRRQQILSAGACASAITSLYICYLIYDELKNGPKRDQKQPQKKGTQLDSALPPGDPLNDAGRKIVLHDTDGREVVQTGNSTVPLFPRVIELPDFASAAPKTTHDQDTAPNVTSPTLIIPPSATGDTEYTLVGLGTRSVSFLGINVYVLGYYIATADIAALQAHLVKKVNPIASTLVSTEKDSLRKSLLDVESSEQIWQELLQAGIPARSCVRVVPVRDTDFPHLRDGFTRAIQARTANETDERFGAAMQEFKRIFARGKVPKQKELLMLRDAQGRLTMVFDDGKSTGRQLLGSVDDERISRALWMNYLGGAKVASEEAKKSIVNGVMEFVERPIGTVATQVI